jgi:hypothetical protein
LDPFPYHEHLEHIAGSESQPPLIPLLPTETYPGAGASLSDYISGPSEHDAHGVLETNLQNNQYNLFRTREEYKYIQCGIMKKGVKNYYDNVQKEGNTALPFPSVKNWDVVQKLVANIQDDLALREWELYTLEDMKLNDNQKCPIKYWSPDIIKSMRWLMQQTAYAALRIYALQR